MREQDQSQPNALNLLEKGIRVKGKEFRLVTVQSRVASRYGLRSDVKTKWFPGLGVRTVRLEP